MTHSTGTQRPERVRRTQDPCTGLYRDRRQLTKARQHEPETGRTTLDLVRRVPTPAVARR